MRGESGENWPGARVREEKGSVCLKMGQDIVLNDFICNPLIGRLSGSQLHCILQRQAEISFPIYETLRACLREYLT